ncbi:hypothetical protein ACTI_68270 [Actinoplanes sp. OR16]|uniref:NAD-dependent epimerase/dehydratase family protein n=1 Tax=Actinoplanes sp. OR16 TaxID=946334 RepID=UPI000F6DE254|nr:NAD(P)-dependent oxidoreductase [Actinoplanes sp. OR16]BBH70142.1 hypothetical protein ACTI_68270 [Actinoplanes sp. OR16]
MTVLITGAAGGVAAYLRPALDSTYELRSTDRTPGDGVITGDLTDAGFARDVCTGADTVVHLAADAGATSIGEDVVPYPCCAYGVVKVFTENMGRLYADQHGLSVICLRLGGVRDEPMARSWLPGWLSGPDLVRLVTGALTTGVHFGVYHGVSANTGSIWRHDRARADLGYQPRDDSAAFVGTVPDDIPAQPAPGVRIAHLT